MWGIGIHFTNILQGFFYMKVFCTDYMYLQIEFVIFCQKKAARKIKMLVKLTIGLF